MANHSEAACRRGGSGLSVLLALLISTPVVAQEMPAPRRVWERPIELPSVERENVFKPFYRLDHARNEGAGNSGLGLAIARDIARSHGGDVALDTSTMGGLRAIIRVPL